MEPSRYLGGLFYQSAGWLIGQGGWLTHSSAFLERLLLSLFTPTPTKSTTMTTLFVKVPTHSLNLSKCSMHRICTIMCQYSVWWKLLPNVKNERVYHTISGLKCGIRRTPPHFFWKPKKKNVGGFIYVYFMWSGEIFLRNFLSYPSNIFQG